MRSRIVVYSVVVIVLALLVYFGLQADTRSFVGSLFAAAVSVLAVVFIEAELRPDIQIVEEPQPAITPDGRKFLRVLVKNRPLWWPLKLIMDRRPANQARAWITFLTEKNDLVFSEGRRMIGRWSATPEPVRPVSVSAHSDANPTIGLLWDLSVTRDAVDVPSGAYETLDVVMRSPLEEGCRGWHNRMIQRADTPSEDQFELGKARYRALVRIDVSGRSFRGLFRIVCDVGIEDFRLEPLPLDPHLR